MTQIGDIPIRHSRNQRAAPIDVETVVRHREGLRPKHYRILMVAANLYDYRGLSEQLRIPEGTVKSQLHRARASLRRLELAQHKAGEIG